MTPLWNIQIFKTKNMTPLWNMYIKDHGMGEAISIKTCSLKEPQKRFSKYSLMGGGSTGPSSKRPSLSPSPGPITRYFKMSS